MRISYFIKFIILNTFFQIVVLKKVLYYWQCNWIGAPNYKTHCVFISIDLKKTFATMKKKNLNSQVYSTIIYFLYLPNIIRKTTLSQIIKSFWGFISNATCFTIKSRAITEICTHGMNFTFFVLSCLWLKMLTTITYTFLRIRLMFCFPEIMIIGKMLFTQWSMCRWYTPKRKLSLPSRFGSIQIS